MISFKGILKSLLPEIIVGSEAKISVAVEKAASRIESGAKDRSRVDTGTMRAGWEYQMEGNHQATVFNLVEYTIYNEYGTVHMSAQPMLHPAVEEVKDEFATDVALAYEVRSPVA